MTTSKGGPPKGQKKSAAHKAKISKAQDGKKNSNYDKGQRLNYRKIAGASDGDATLVHHLDSDRTNNSPSNLQRLKAKKKGYKTSSYHEKITDRHQGKKVKK